MPTWRPDTGRQLGNMQRRRMKKSILVLSIFVLSGCAAGVKPITTPDGKRGFVVTCDGSADDWLPARDHILSAQPNGLCGGGMVEARVRAVGHETATFRMGYGTAGDFTLTPTAF